MTIGMVSKTSKLRYSLIPSNHPLSPLPRRKRRNLLLTERMERVKKENLMVKEKRRAKEILVKRRVVRKRTEIVPYAVSTLVIPMHSVGPLTTTMLPRPKSLSIVPNPRWQNFSRILMLLPPSEKILTNYHCHTCLYVHYFYTNQYIFVFDFIYFISKIARKREASN